jgi:hypothetical protein
MQFELLKAAIDMLLQLLRIRAKRDAMEVQLERVVKLYDAMSTFSSLKDIHRVIVLKIENSGGLIDPKVQLYASVLHEDYTFPVVSVKTKYTKLPIDQIYVRMLHSVIKEQHVHYLTDEMEDGILKTIYHSSGIKAADIFYLGSNPKSMYIMSVASVNSDDVFKSDEYRINATIAVEEIKKALWNKSVR